MSRDCTYASANAGTGCDDPFGHGTHVAGIIGATADNSEGISGVCWNVKMVSLRVVDADYSISSENLVRAIEYAQETLYDSSSTNNIRILNMSLGGSSFSANWHPVLIAINDYEGLIICSAGNDNQNNDMYSIYPANYSYEYSHIISVGASNVYDQMAPFSNYGEETVDIFAPGSGILSCYPTAKCQDLSHNLNTHYEDGYHMLDGTSMAAPYVAGVAALMLSCNPSLSAADIKTAINETADKLLAFDGKCVSGGRLNALAALQEVHNHSYTYTYTATTHTANCSCGYTTGAVAHTFVISGNQYACSGCGYVSDYQLNDTPDTES